MTRQVKIAFAVPLTILLVVALLVGVGLLAGCGASSSSAGSGGGTTSLDAGRSSAQLEAPVPAPAADGIIGSSSGTATKSTTGGSAGGDDYSAAVPPASAPSTHYLLRTGDMSLLVARGQLLPTVDRVKAMTAAMNGYVTSSALGTQSSGMPEPMPLGDATADGSIAGSGVAPSQYADGNPYASLVVRVPEQLFDTAIKRFSRLGEVQSASTSSEDVTSQYVDLRARLRHYRAVERRLLGFLQETTTVNQMLAVQDRIDQVQLTIEELSAQLKSLSETTTYGTLSVYVSEKDRTPVTIQDSNTFGGTLSNSIKLLGRGIRLTGLVLTALAPFIIVFGAIAVLAWFLVRRVRRRRREAAQPAQPA